MWRASSFKTFQFSGCLDKSASFLNLRTLSFSSNHIQFNYISKKLNVCFGWFSISNSFDALQMKTMSSNFFGVHRHYNLWFPHFILAYTVILSSSLTVDCHNTSIKISQSRFVQSCLEL